MQPHLLCQSDHYRIGSKSPIFGHVCGSEALELRLDESMAANGVCYRHDMYGLVDLITQAVSSCLSMALEPTLAMTVLLFVQSRMATAPRVVPKTC